MSDSAQLDLSSDGYRTIYIVCYFIILEIHTRPGYTSLSRMPPKEQEIRELAAAIPFLPFAVVTSSGERYRVLTHDHIFFSPNTDEEGNPLPEEDRAQSFILWGRGARHRVRFFDAITAIDFGISQGS
jgi:hypothetical protein